MWILNFGFTEYRSHLAYIGLPLGIVTLGVSLALLYVGFSRTARGCRAREEEDDAL